MRTFNQQHRGCGPAACACHSQDTTLGRREFLKISGLAAASLALARLPVMAGPFTRADFTKLVPEDKKLDPAWVKSLFVNSNEKGSVNSNVAFPHLAMRPESKVARNY